MRDVYATPGIYISRKQRLVARLERDMVELQRQWARLARRKARVQPVERWK